MLFLQLMSLFDLLSSWTVVLMQSPCAEICWKLLDFSWRSVFSELSYIQDFLCYPVNHDVNEKEKKILLGSCLY